MRWVVDTSSIPADFMTLGIANQLKQVLLNISLNAVDAMQPQGGELTLRTLYDLETDRVGLQLQDTGPGLDEKVIPNLFEPFLPPKNLELVWAWPFVMILCKIMVGRLQLRMLKCPGMGRFYYLAAV